MTDHDTTSSESLDPATTAAWQEFEHLLDNVLIHMDDPQDGDHLIVQLEGKQTPYLQFATTDGGRHLRVEVSGNAHLALAWQLTSDQCSRCASTDGRATRTTSRTGSPTSGR